MPEHYDSLETRDAAVREREQFARLGEVVARAMTAPGWAKHLDGIDPKSVASRGSLAKLPVMRKSDISALQKTVWRAQRDCAGQSAAFADVAGSNLRT